MPRPISADTGARRLDGGPPALRLAGLTKAFGHNTAVDRVDLTVAAGSFFGLVGPNGAGKTTALSMAVGLLRPDAGSSAVFGIDMWSGSGAGQGFARGAARQPRAARAADRAGAPHVSRPAPRLDPAAVTERTRELLAVMDLEDAERTLIVDYSTGMRKKIGLATALLHAPGCWCSTNRSRRSTRCRPWC
jgi:ABC-2 type transport system ATP-binding protein